MDKYLKMMSVKIKRTNPDIIYENYSKNYDYYISITRKKKYMVVFGNDNNLIPDIPEDVYHLNLIDISSDKKIPVIPESVRYLIVSHSFNAEKSKIFMENLPRNLLGLSIAPFNKNVELYNISHLKNLKYIGFCSESLVGRILDSVNKENLPEKTKYISVYVNGSFPKNIPVNIEGLRIYGDLEIIDDMAHFKKMKYLSIRTKAKIINSLPEKLITLKISSNNFTEVPRSIRNLSLLKELDISFNVKELKESSFDILKNMKNLKEIKK